MDSDERAGPHCSNTYSKGKLPKLSDLNLEHIEEEDEHMVNLTDLFSGKEIDPLDNLPKLDSPETESKQVINKQQMSTVSI